MENALSLDAALIALILAFTINGATVAYPAPLSGRLDHAQGILANG